MVKKVVLISSGQPSLNPRLVKEADALCAAGYAVTVLYAYWNDWGTKHDQQLFRNKPWKAIRIGGSPTVERITFLLSRLIQALSKQAIKHNKIFQYAHEFAISRSAYFLIKNAKKYAADLYIAHNLGALPATVIAAKYHQKPCGFDAEDFHRHEMSNAPDDDGVRLAAYIENKYIPQVNYFTASSPQIAEAYKMLFPSLKPVTILNVFPASKVTVAVNNTAGPIKLFWFSQSIGPGRGIEDVISAMQKADTSAFELHLLGNISTHNKDFIDQLDNKSISIQFHPPIVADDIIDFASQFDIGLALEPGFSINNDLALSNKLFTYMQAGLAIIASNTAAQQDLMIRNPKIGALYPIGDTDALADILLAFKNNRKKLFDCKTASLQAGHNKYNWESESRAFINVIQDVLNSNES